MVEQPHQQIRQALDSVQGLYHRLTLLVGISGTGKTRILQSLATDLRVPVINVNQLLSSRLLEMAAKQRATQVSRLLGELAEGEGSPVIFDNLEILFDRQLKQDPLRLLQRVSRNHTLLASWNGRYENGRLSYAALGHPEYRTYESLETVIVTPYGTSTISAAGNQLKANSE